MKWILLVLMTLHVQVTAGEIKLRFDDGTEDRGEAEYLATLLGEKRVRSFGVAEVHDMTYVDFYTQIKAFMKVGGGKLCMTVRFEQEFSANKALEALKELSKLGVKRLVFLKELEEEVFENVKVRSGKKKVT